MPLYGSAHPPIYQIAAKLGKADGATRAFYASLKGVVKTNEEIAHCVANEYLAGEIGRFLGLPIPPGAIVKLDDKTFGYVSMDFSFTNETLPPVRPTLCWEKMAELTTGVLLFDIFVANSDRHVGNVSASLGGAVVKMNVFDHSHALFSFDAMTGVRRLKKLISENDLGITGKTYTGSPSVHCFLDVVKTDNHFGGWQERIATIPDHFFETRVSHLTQLEILNELESQAVMDYLKARRDSFPALIKNNQSKFTAVSSWSLL